MLQKSQSKNFVRFILTTIGLVVLYPFEKITCYCILLFKKLKALKIPMIKTPRISFHRLKFPKLLIKSYVNNIKFKFSMALDFLANKFSKFILSSKPSEKVSENIKATQTPLDLLIISKKLENLKERVNRPVTHTALHAIILFIYGVLFATVFVYLPIEAYAWLRQLPKVEILATEATKSAFPTRIWDRKGRLLYEIYLDKRYEPVSLSKVPKNLINATLAIEDDQFYNHSGYRVESMLRAAKASLFDNNLQGASTITQQLVKNVLLTPERTFTRKLRELVLAVLVENKYSKDKILEMYLNNISYGGNAWGVQTASQKYFGKNVYELDLAEASLLAGLPSAPSIYSPSNSDLELTKQRQRLVLDRMVSLGYINKDEAESAYKKELNFVQPSEYILAPHFVAFVRDELNKKYGKRYVDYSGLKIVTTLDLDLQDKVAQIVKEEVVKSKYLRFSNGAAVVVDSKNSEILAYVGSIDYNIAGWGAFDVASAYRQPGSSIKPITYALALEKGFTPASLIDDSAISFQSGTEVYRPVNYDGAFHGVVTLRSALANSYNIPAVKTVKSVGPDNMVELARKMGLTNWVVGDGSYGLSVTLGGKEVRLVDLINVFATFARQGKYKQLSPVISITDGLGFEIYNSSERSSEQVIKPETAYLISNILSDNVARTPAFGALSNLVIPNHTVAVKTGTTDYKKDNWTLGYTPSYAVGVWVGNNDNTPMNPYLASGLSGAAPIWNKIMLTVLKDLPNEPFVVPSGIVTVTDPQCGNRTEYFACGSAIPQRLCVVKKDDKDKDKKEKDRKKRD